MRRFNDIIILFSIMFAAAGCCRHDKITVEDNVRITLSPVVSAGTKAVVNDKNDLLAQSYGDTGMWCAYFGCDTQDVKRCLRLVRRELDKLMKTPISSAISLTRQLPWSTPLATMSPPISSRAIPTAKTGWRKNSPISK